MKKILILLLCLGLGGCATVPTNIRPTGTAVTNSYGNPDIAKYKTFTIGYTSQPGTSKFLRDFPILNNIAFRFQQEGLKLVKNSEEVDILIAMDLIDAVGQEYVPPSTYTSVSYNPGTTTTSMMGTATSFGNFVNFQGTAHSTSTASATATTVTRGGYYVPSYGIAIALNIYDTKTKQLVWSGAGARKARIKNIYPAASDIILQLIDDHLITPTYIAGKREEIRGRYLNKSNEYLQHKGKTGPSVITYSEIDQIKLFTNLSVLRGSAGELLMLFITLNNNTDKDFVFNPTIELCICNRNDVGVGFVGVKGRKVPIGFAKLNNVKVYLDEEELVVFSKSQIAEAAFNLKKNIEFNPIYGQGLIGVLIASAFNKASDIKQQIQKEKIDASVRMAYEKYMDIHTLKPKETYQTFAYIGGFVFIPDQSTIKAVLPLVDRQIELVYTYVPNCMTYVAYEKYKAKRGLKF